MHAHALPIPVRFTLVVASVLLVSLLLPELADARSSWSRVLAADGVPSPNNELVLPGVQALSLLFGAIVPLCGYVLNHHAPWVTEPVKALVQVLLAAVAGALAQLLKAGDLAFDLETLEVVGIAVIGALAAHQTLWLPSGVSTALGGGTNRQTG